MIKRIALLLVSAVVATVAPIANPVLAAQSSKPAPAELSNIVYALDKAANQQDIEAVMKYYDPTFRHADGLDRDFNQKRHQPSRFREKTHSALQTVDFFPPVQPANFFPMPIHGAFFWS